ncbi:O-fucosyltransferase 15 [Sesamum angolense]|uniref:O-fucosyltransferase family protein n=1 Tax=Sesamum angolense TaxID=2727404 RepID=A0AAE1WSK5_9LAMI|nr:O-fucosyltransferase 15 [Sesamum angolense]
MSLSGPSDVATLGRGNISSENDDDYQGKDLGSRVSGRNSISSTRISSSSPRGSCTSSTLSQLSILSLSPAVSNGYLSSALFEPKKTRKSKRKPWSRKRMVVGLAVLLGFLFLMNSWMLSRIQEAGGARGYIKVKFLKANSSTVFIREELQKLGRWKKPQKTIYARLLAKAAHAMAEGESKPEPKDLWVEPYISASSWTPCANARDWEPSEGKTGYIMVTANGGINQQRVAVCNAVAVARLLNATLVLPKFMYSSVWRDASQFGDIYQEDHFINYLKPDIPIVKELPKELQSLDLEAIGSVVSDVDVVKEAKPSFYLKYILPILHLNRVVHFVGFGNRLASDPIPYQLQRLRCRCNFHALRFVPKLQEAGALLIQRMRQNDTGLGHLDNYLVGPFAQSQEKGQRVRATKMSRYLALHLRFEIDMVAHSLCEFGGGEEEMRELEAYRNVHFPALVELKKAKKFSSPAVLRSEGLCPLTPEETVLMLAALGFNRRTHIYLAGAHIYGGNSRLASLTTLFPNLVTKESLLSSTEIEPFANFSSQLAALDFIVCTAADAFAMTDSGSQFSSLIAGYRIYYGGGKMPTIRPNKRRLADIFLKNNTIEWKIFETRVRKAVRQNKRVFSRPVGRSVYRYPRCRDCMCSSD